MIANRKNIPKKKSILANGPFMAGVCLELSKIFYTLSLRFVVGAPHFPVFAVNTLPEVSG